MIGFYVKMCYNIGYLVIFMEKSMIKLPLSTENNRSFRLNSGKLELLKQDLKDFFEGQEYMLSRTFAHDVLFTHEVKFNNAVEEYKDDIHVVEETISNPRRRNLTEQERRIMNLYKGYHYIFDENKDINKVSLKELYRLLSFKLLEEDELKNMGEFYRNNPVYIFFSDNMNVKPDMGVSPDHIENMMDQLFHFSKEWETSDLTDDYIKAQIMHLFFVYIHPYYDINGRTSRTMSIWYLLNKSAYPYIIFNRGITLQKNAYYKVIRKCKKEADMTDFILYMLNTVLVELQKEYVIHHINKTVPLTNLEHQTIQYLLSLNGLKSVGDFVHFYHAHNEKRSPKEIMETMIMPLLEKDILTVERNSKKFLYSGQPNTILSFHLNDFDIEKEKVRRLSI